MGTRAPRKLPRVSSLLARMPVKMVGVLVIILLRLILWIKIMTDATEIYISWVYYNRRKGIWLVWWNYRRDLMSRRTSVSLRP